MPFTRAIPRTACGGTDKDRDTRIYQMALYKAAKLMREHPCGCNVCYADALLSSLHLLRKAAKLDPFSGEAEC